MKYKLDYVVQENGKWFAEVSKQGTSARENTKELWGEKGLGYNSLKFRLMEHYNIELPMIKELVLIRKTTCKRIYSVA